MVESTYAKREKLIRAVAALDAQRAASGDKVTDAIGSPACLGLYPTETSIPEAILTDDYPDQLSPVYKYNEFLNDGGIVPLRACIAWESPVGARRQRLFGLREYKRV